MINRIIAFSIENKLIIGLFTIALIVTGIWSVSKVPLDAVPDITNNQVQVITQAPNLGTEDIEQFVTYPVEVAMANLPGIQEIRSISRFGISVVTVVFDDDMGTYLPRQLVSEKLVEVKNEIPAGFGEPFMGPISTGLGEIYQYTLSVDSGFEYSAMELRSIQDWIVRRQMAMVPGVVEVNAFGGDIKQYEVAVDPEELRAMGISIVDVFTALEQNNQNTGGAYIERNHQANFIRGEGLARSIADIENIVVANQNGIPVKVGDVAKVQMGRAVRYGAFTKDGQGEAVGGMILMLKGANSNNVIVDVKERFEQIEQSLPEGVNIVPFLDRSTLIQETTSTVSNNLMEGALIVIFVLVFLLGNWRGGLIVASTIPLSLLFAFILMNVFDVWANLMSLGAIDFGIIVDGAVIIVEGTVFLVTRRVMSGGKLSRKERDKEAYSASSKMMNSAFFGQLIILIVFLPILFLEGVEGKMFKPMALTFMFAMIGAMILCLTYVPMISALFIKVSPKHKASWGDKFIIWLENKYEIVLNTVIRNTKVVLVTAVVLFGLAIFSFTRMGGEFIPQLDEGDLAFHVILQPGSALSESIDATTKAEQILLENFPEVKHVMSRIGVADVPTDPMPMDVADVIVTLKPVDEWTSAESKGELVNKMKAALDNLPGVNYEFTQPIEMRFNELLTGVREDVAVKLYGEDLDILAAKAEEIGKLIAPIQGVGDMKVEATSGLPQMTVRYNRSKLAQYGINVNEVNTLIESAFGGGTAGVIFEGEKRYDLVVRFREDYRQNIGNLQNMYVTTPGGSQIPLKEIAEVSYEPGPMQISRDNTNRRTYVGVNVRDRDVKSLVEEIRDKLDAELELPPGYYIRYGGAFENLERATGRLKIVVPIALGLIFILIFFALKSVKQSLMIYMSIPLAAIGGVFSLLLRDMPFSISAGVGFIVLFGVAVLNGLVLISGWNELKEEGEKNLDNRIRMGAKRRIRPIMLTALTDVLGFLPMALSTTAGAEVQQPLATVVIGGLITSTLLTLFILPILYRYVESREGSFKVSPALATVLLLVGVSLPVVAQEQSVPVTMEWAVKRALEKYPSIQASQWQVEQQQKLVKTGVDLGNTQIYTGGEEIQKGQPDGVYTMIGIQQQNIDVFGSFSKTKSKKRQVALAEAALNLSKQQLTQQVKMAYGNLIVAQSKLELYASLDSIFKEFERAVSLQYEVEEIARLAYVAGVNQVRQMSVQAVQAEFDYNSALQRFNLWMMSDTVYVPDESTSWAETQLEVNNMEQTIENHPLYQMAEQQVEVAEAQRKMAGAGFLPKLNVQYGLQSIGMSEDFYTYQLGISVPLIFNGEMGRSQAAKVGQYVAEEQRSQARLELEVNLNTAINEYQKWQKTYAFYQSEALPLVKEQREGALIAFEEGALDYVGFIQNIKESTLMELQAQEALRNYLQARFQLEYLLNSNN